MIHNFTQIQGQEWRVRLVDKPGPSFNAMTSDREKAMTMFLEWMWGGKHRPDRMSFAQFRKTQRFKFFYEPTTPLH